MTIREIADITGYTVRGVSKHISKKHPSIITSKGTKVELSDTQALEVLKGLKVELQSKTEIRTQFQQPRTQFQPADYEFIANAVASAIAKHIVPLLQTHQRAEPLQIEHTHITALAYSIQNGLPSDYRSVHKLGYYASIYSREHGLSIEKVSDQRYGKVNAYTIAALEAAS